MMAQTKQQEKDFALTQFLLTSSPKNSYGVLTNKKITPTLDLWRKNQQKDQQQKRHLQNILLICSLSDQHASLRSTFW